MFFKRRSRSKDGKSHIYCSVCERLRVSRDRVVQRQVLHLSELNTTRFNSWQHSIDVLHDHRLESRLRKIRPSGLEGGAKSIPRLYPHPRSIVVPLRNSG